jgi:MarR-like DNA-binding transcriptional regulator SgrR of sgrS sRNA
MAPDGRSWTFWRREGAPFHFGWGQLTARDVEHSLGMFTEKESIAFTAGTLRRLIDRLEVNSAHLITIYLKQPGPTLEHYVSERLLLATMSKAQ